MRALCMDFPNDENVAGIVDEYMFGPASAEMKVS
jgi:alpha-glucosidase (family GH31 glycosyl hydrolase)